MKLAALAAATLAAALIAPPAHADTPGCVTLSEYQSAHEGMTKGSIRDLFDTGGFQSGAYQTSDAYHIWQTYVSCSGGWRANVHYRDLKGGEDVWRAVDLSRSS